MNFIKAITMASAARAAAWTLASLCGAGLACSAAHAETRDSQAASATSAPVAAPAPAPIGFATVAEALASLEARDGNGTIVTHPEGWVVINEPLAKAQWSFTPREHAAYPAVVRRIIQRGGPGGTSVDTASLCEAPAAACAALLVEFQAMNERITQAVQARGRQGSSMPPPPAAPAPRP